MPAWLMNGAVQAAEHIDWPYQHISKGVASRAAGHHGMQSMQADWRSIGCLPS
jgi:hypothetical protein